MSGGSRRARGVPSGQAVRFGSALTRAWSWSPAVVSRTRLILTVRSALAPLLVRLAVAGPQL